MNGGETRAERIVVRGVVQGVGFRPFVFRLARRHGLAGWVSNSSRGVIVEAEGPAGSIDAFAAELAGEAPPLARIDEVAREVIPVDGRGPFEIRTSRAEEGEVTLICPDVAVCPDCLREFRDPDDRRYRYPFINCTNCGPRFSIIEETPYDRPLTSMRRFAMCPDCLREYGDPLDRRFHAQPDACPVCGPRLSLLLPANPVERTAEIVSGRRYVRMPEEVAAGIDRDPAAVARWLLARGAIVGVKGLGGFHIAADATDDDAVRALREKKARPAKPFALMCRSLESAKKIATIEPEEERLLESPWAPVVLVAKRGDPALRLSREVAPRQRTLGIMLPYAPLHHLLFDDHLEALVMTSANVAGEPIVSDSDEARERLGGITRTFLDHDRAIVNRSDDSVAFVERGSVSMMRRSRGYAPYPIDLALDGGRVLAAGPELKNTFTLLDGSRAYVSQHIGRLDSRATLDFYEEMVEKFLGWFGTDPEVVAHDLHPDYLSTRFAAEFARRRGLDLVGVQHHHAHIASVAAEHGRRDRLVGLSFDGTGYGTDGAIWGCEFLVCDLAGFERAGHLAYVPLPGGDAATRHPYRVALAHLFAAGGVGLAQESLPLFPDVPAPELDLVLQQTEKGVNAISTSSAGRLFDAVSAILGVCHETTYEAQAPIELEALVDRSATEPYPYGIEDGPDGFEIDAGPVVRSVLREALDGVDAATVAGRFHATFVEFSREAVRRVADGAGTRSVALSGGVFQNRYLLGRLREALISDGFEVLTNIAVPANDGGVSLGEAVVASEVARLERT